MHCRSLVSLVVVLSSMATAIQGLASSVMSRREASIMMVAAPSSASLVWMLQCESACAANTAAQDGYIKGPQGLLYLITNEGTGQKPQRGQKIQTSYTLWINGFPGDEQGAKQIDSSKKPILGDQPFKVRAGVSQVIKGWDLALLDMKEGESRRLIVPPELGYGDKGVGPIPSKATLYFEMKLTVVEPMEELSDDAKKWLDDHPLS